MQLIGFSDNRIFCFLLLFFRSLSNFRKKRLVSSIIIAWSISRIWRRGHISYSLIIHSSSVRSIPPHSFSFKFRNRKLFFFNLLLLRLLIGVLSYIHDSLNNLISIRSFLCLKFREDYMSFIIYFKWSNSRISVWDIITHWNFTSLYDGSWN